MFQFPTFAHLLKVCRRLADGLPHSEIRGPPRDFSQLITSFFASESLGILLSPLLTFFCRRSLRFR